MHRSLLTGLPIPLFLMLSGALAGCGESDSPAAELELAPDTANVATCRSQVFTATPADAVTWSLEGEGELTDGTYDAPIAVPSPATATITATRDAASASATVTLATAFPEGAIDSARVTSNATPDHVHGVVARGDRAYALSEGQSDSGSTLALLRSDDGGLTWGSPVAFPGGRHVASIAMDAGDDDTVYVTLQGDEDGAGSTLDLAVSTDGGANFTLHSLFDGGNGEAQGADVVSPDAGTVVVVAPATWQDGNGGQGATLLRWRDTKKGAGILGMTALDNGYDGQWFPGVETRLESGRLIETNSNRGGPQLSTNGKGVICQILSDYDINGADQHDDVSCSGDGGESFGDPVQVTTGKPSDIDRARVALGPDGKLVVVTYNAFNDGSLDSIGTTVHRVSSDGGKTFGAPHTQADVLAEDGQKKGVAGAEAYIDGDGVIWFVRNVDDSSLQLDKSCDQGETLSGAFTLPIQGSHLDGFFFSSSAGFFAGGVRRGDGDTGLTVVRILAP